MFIADGETEGGLWAVEEVNSVLCLALGDELTCREGGGGGDGDGMEK